MTDEVITEAVSEPVSAAPNRAKLAAATAAPVKASKRPTRKKRARVRARAKSEGGTKPSAAKADGRSGPKPFPAATFEEALELALAIQQLSSGKPIRRLTLFDQLKKSPDSSVSRSLVTNSHRYGLTTGNYSSDSLALTPEGLIASSNEADPVERLRTRFKLAIEQQPPFKALYDQFKGSKLPSHAVLRDAATDLGIDASLVQECVDTFILNAKFLGLLKPISGTERLLSLEHILEELPRTSASSGGFVDIQVVRPPGAPAAASTGDWNQICFYITPIGDEDSPERQHSDLFLGSIVEPAIADLGLTVVRADKIGKPGMITRQTIEHIVRSKLVIADLSLGGTSAPSL